MTQGIPGGTKIETGKTNSTQGTNSACDRSVNNKNLFLLDVPLHLDPLLKHSTLQSTNKTKNSSNINLDFEEILPFQEFFEDRNWLLPQNYLASEGKNENVTNVTSLRPSVKEEE